MKINISYLFLGIIFALSFSGCLVKKADSQSVSSFDYNYRRKVEGAYYVKKRTPIGLGVVIGSTAIGASVGAASRPFAYYSGTEKKSGAFMDVVLGSLLGYGIAHSVEMFFGFKTKTDIGSPARWVRKANNNYKLVAEQPDKKNSFTVIHEEAEKNFNIRTIEDARHFAYAFPNSRHTDETVGSGYRAIPREQLPELLTLFPKTIHQHDIQAFFLEKSSDVAQCAEAKNKYPDLYKDAEKKAAGYVKSVENAVLFSREFANSPYAEQVVTQAIKSAQRGQLPQLVDIYPQLDLARQAYIQQSKNLTEYLEATDRYVGVAKNVEQKSADYVSSLADIKIFKQRFGSNAEHLNTAFNNAIKYCERHEVLEMLSMFDNLSKENIYNAHKRYIIMSEGIADLLLAIEKYPDSTLNISSSEPHINIQEGRLFADKLKNNLHYFGQDNLNRLNKSLSEIVLQHEYNKTNNDKNLIEDFKNILSDNWIDKSISEKYLLVAIKQIMAIDFEEAKQNSPEGFIGFIEKYRGTEEAKKATDYLNDFVAKNVTYEAGPKYFLNRGDRGWFNDFAESSRNLIKGGDDYNVFVWGALRNKSSYPLTLKVTTTLNLITTRNLTILIEQVDKHEIREYFMLLPPNSTSVFMTLYRNQVGGTSIGSGFFSAGSSTVVNHNNPTKITYEYYPEVIPEKTLKEQENFIRTVIKNKGNIDVKGGTEDELAFIDKFILGSDYKGAILRIFSEYKGKFKVVITNERGIETDKDELDGTDREDLRGEYGKSYKLTITNNIGIQKVYNITLDNRIVSFLVDKDFNGSIIYKEKVD